LLLVNLFHPLANKALLANFSADRLLGDTEPGSSSMDRDFVKDNDNNGECDCGLSLLLLLLVVAAAAASDVD
jgi:hypothetical protein